MKLAYLLAAAALLSAAGAIAYGVVQFTRDEEPANVAAPEETDAPGDGRLLSGTRDNLSVCVDGAGGLEINGEDVDDIESALDEALASVPNVPEEFSNPDVSEGCPEPRAPMGQAISRFDVESRLVEAPVPHLLMVYVLSPELFAATFPDERYAKTAEEHVCRPGGDTCVTVTSGLYLPSPAGTTLLRDALLDGLALSPYKPTPDPTIDWRACERGELPHPDFTCEGWQDNLADQERDIAQATAEAGQR